MKDIPDCRGHLICKVKPSDGFIESLYKLQTTKTRLPIVGNITIERDGVRTIIIRRDSTVLDVEIKELAM